MPIRFVLALSKAEQLGLFGPSKLTQVAGHQRVTHSGTVATVAPHQRHVKAAQTPVEAAADPSTSAEELTKLAEHPDPNVRGKVIHNPSTPAGVRDQFVNDRDHGIRMEHATWKVMQEQAKEGKVGGLLARDITPAQVAESKAAVLGYPSTDWKPPASAPATDVSDDPFDQAVANSKPGSWTPILDRYAPPSQHAMLGAWLDRYARTGQDAKDLLDGRDSAPEAGLRTGTPGELNELARRLKFTRVTSPDAVQLTPAPPPPPPAPPSKQRLVPTVGRVAEIGQKVAEVNSAANRADWHYHLGHLAGLIRGPSPGSFRLKPPAGIPLQNAQIALDLNEAAASWGVEPWESRGKPKATKGSPLPPVKFETAQFRLHADATDFSIRDKHDTFNEPTIIPPMKASKTAVKKMHAWMSDPANQAKMDRMNFHQLMVALSEAGIRYHYYLAVD